MPPEKLQNKSCLVAGDIAQLVLLLPPSTSWRPEVQNSSEPRLPLLIPARSWEMKAPESLLDTTSAPARPAPPLQSKQMEKGRHGRAEANEFLCSRPPLVMTLWSSHSCSSSFCGITHAAASFCGEFLVSGFPSCFA